MVQKLILPKSGTLEVDIAVTNGNDVAFELDTDSVNEPFPRGCMITGVDVTPHDAADPKVAATTIWRMRLYRRNAKEAGDLLYEETKYTLPTDNTPSFDNTPFKFENGDGVGSIYGTIGIETAATDVSFRIAISFDRR